MLRSVTIILARLTLFLLMSLTLLSSVTVAQVKTEEKPKAEKAKPKKNYEGQKADIAAPKGDPNDPKNGFIKRHESFNKRIKEGNADLLFIGDSITQAWESNGPSVEKQNGKKSNGGKQVWENFYGKRNAVNLGISGDLTQHVLWRLENGNLDGPIKPKVAVIMIGTNNIGSDYSPEDTAAGVEKIVKTVHTKLPETKILLLAIFPRDESPTDQKRENIVKTNEIIKKLNDGKSIFYLDIGQKFLDKDGILTKEIMPDALHPNEKGYQIWADAIEEKLAMLMGEK